MTTADDVSANEASMEPTDPADMVGVSRVQVGDIVTIPGTSLDRCRIRLVRSPVPGVIWLYLADSNTDWPLRGHVALPLNRSVLRHGVTAPVDPDVAPEDN